RRFATVHAFAFALEQAANQSVSQQRLPTAEKLWSGPPWSQQSTPTAVNHRPEPTSSTSVLGAPSSVPLHASTPPTAPFITSIEYGGTPGIHPLYSAKSQSDNTSQPTPSPPQFAPHPIPPQGAWPIGNPVAQQHIQKQRLFSRRIFIAGSMVG